METTNKTFVPVAAIHPTELIKDEMRERGLKRRELAARMGIKLPNLSRLLNKKESITPQTAIRLENALGIDADMWLSLQAAYDKDLVAIADRDNQEKEATSIENVLAGVQNIKLLFKRLGLDSYTFAKDRIKALYKTFNVSNIDEIISLAAPTGRFKKSEKLATDDKNLNTWVLLAHRECLVNNVLTTYNDGCAVLAANEIAKLANSGSVTEEAIKDVLYCHGIGYSWVAKIEKAPIDAYSTKINGTPYIITSHRHNNMDMLVFDVLHELKHIHTDLHDGESNLSFNSESNKLDEKEIEANKFAEDMLIPPLIWSKIIKAQSKSLNPYHVFNKVIEEATKHGISASIASWRYRHETKIYARKGYCSAKIR